MRPDKIIITFNDGTVSEYYIDDYWMKDGWIYFRKHMDDIMIYPNVSIKEIVMKTHS